MMYRTNHQAMVRALETAHDKIPPCFTGMATKTALATLLGSLAASLARVSPL